MVAQFPSSTNVFVRDHAASGNLIVDFSRDPKKFAVASYAQIVPVTKTAGYYMEMSVEEAGRLLNANLEDFAWPDGQSAPEDFDGTESFQFKEFLTQRRKFGATLGDKTIDQSSWDITASHAGIKAQQAMTARTQLVVSIATNANNYPAAHTADVAAGIPGNTGKWSASTTARQDIRRSITHACEQILDSTLAAVDLDAMQLVVSSNCAREMALSQEIVDYIKGSPEALAQVRGELPNENVMYGLPSQLYGVPVVVEKTRKTTSRKGATRATSAVMPDASPFICSRPGDLEGLYGAPSFSTITLFMLEEMTTETKHDDDNRLTRLRVVEDYVPVMTAPVSGFLFTNAI